MIMRRIRERTEMIITKYGLPRECAAMIRKAINADVKRNMGVKDFHDLPEAKLGLCVSDVDTWESYRLVREIRAKLLGVNA